MQTKLNGSKLDFGFLNQSDFQARYAFGEQKASMRFQVTGIQCSKCIRKLEDLPKRHKGLLDARVVMGQKLVYIDIDPTQTSFAEIANSIRDLGFEVTALLPDDQSEKFEKKENRIEMVRLAIAGTCAANIMTFSFANYFGAAAEFKPLFQWLSFFFYLPVLFFVAIPFYRGAVASLKQRRLSIDLPMAVASIAGFLFSSLALLRGRDDLYFDSMSGFLFLILIARSFQSRLQRQTLQDTSNHLQSDRYRVFNKDGWKWSPTFEVGQTLLISQNEIVPANCKLESHVAHLSLAWLSGESKPKTFLEGAIVPAGARLTSPQAVFKVETALVETDFGRILVEIQKFSLSKSKVINQGDRWSQWLLGIVFSVAIVFLATYWSISPEESIRRSLALIIVACPCAMAFGTPLAIATALRRSRRLGLLIRNANVFEDLRAIKTVFFDKTGTLTDSELELVDDARTISPTHQALVLALENRSFHPIAFAFRDRFSVPVLPIVENWQEIPGQGVSGTIAGHFIELRKDKNQSTDVTCSLYEDGILLETFMFEAPLKEGVQEVLQSLRTQKLRVILLSGDKKSAVDHLAQKLGFSPDDIHSDCSPEDKATLVVRNSPAMMVGDGINDSLALMRSAVGVATSGSMEGALKSAGVYLINPDLNGILKLREISFQLHNLIKSNLLLSVGYNMGAGFLALSGMMNPFLAALLMPISSAVILLHTWLRSSF